VLAKLLGNMGRNRDQPAIHTRLKHLPAQRHDVRVGYTSRGRVRQNHDVQRHALGTEGSSAPGEVTAAAIRTARSAQRSIENLIVIIS
jgi:hypothetical protein